MLTTGKRLPNFLIIGAAKSGTTSICAYLEQHPEIYLSSTKETNFFAFKDQEVNIKKDTLTQSYLQGIITDTEQYKKKFYEASGERAVGEASPIYLYSKEACQNIHDCLPNVKLIAILRNPVDRAYSNFLHHIREGLETTDSFEQALAEEKQRIHELWWWGFHYTKAGFYYEQLQRYFARFNTENIKVYLYEDLIGNSDQLFRDIFDFLSVDNNFKPQQVDRQNVTGVPKNKLWHNFLSKPNLIKEPIKLLLPSSLRKQIVEKLRVKNLSRPPMAPETRVRLTAIFRDDILKLQDLIQRDLSNWL